MDYKLLAKNEKDKTSPKYQNGNKDKTTSHNLLSANISQFQIQALRKEKCHANC